MVVLQWVLDFRNGACRDGPGHDGGGLYGGGGGGDSGGDGGGRFVTLGSGIHARVNQCG